MGNVDSQPGKVDKKTTNDGEKKLKPCCACPETKRARDEW